MNDTTKKQKEERVAIVQSYIAEHEAELLQWAMDEGLIYKVPTDPREKKFVLEETISRKKQIEAMHAIDPDLEIRQMPADARFDIMYYSGGTLCVSEGKYRYENYGTYDSYVLSKDKYDIIKSYTASNADIKAFFQVITFDHTTIRYDITTTPVENKEIVHKKYHAVNSDKVNSHVMDFKLKHATNILHYDK